MHRHQERSAGASIQTVSAAFPVWRRCAGWRRPCGICSSPGACAAWEPGEVGRGSARPVVRGTARAATRPAGATCAHTGREATGGLRSLRSTCNCAGGPSDLRAGRFPNLHAQRMRAVAGHTEPCPSLIALPSHLLGPQAAPGRTGAQPSAWSRATRAQGGCRGAPRSPHQYQRELLQLHRRQTRCWHQVPHPPQHVLRGSRRSRPAGWAVLFAVPVFANDPCISVTAGAGPLQPWVQPPRRPAPPTCVRMPEQPPNRLCVSSNITVPASPAEALQKPAQV